MGKCETNELQGQGTIPWSNSLNRVFRQRWEMEEKRLV